MDPGNIKSKSFIQIPGISRKRNQEYCGMCMAGEDKIATNIMIHVPAIQLTIFNIYHEEQQQCLIGFGFAFLTRCLNKCVCHLEIKYRSYHFAGLIVNFWI